MSEIVPSQMTLKVKNQDGEEVFFKIKSTTPFKKLMDAYCARHRLDSTTARFHFDGQRITESKTPSQLGMLDGDEIDFAFGQTGGASQFQ